MRTYYESPEYECEGKPGTFAGISIIGDDDGPHFVFSSADQVYFDLPISAGEALAISYALSRSARHSIVAAERLTQAWQTEADTLPRAEPPAAVTDAPAIAMTPYGRREIGPGEFPPREVRGEPEPASLPHAHIDHTRELPVQGYSAPASWLRQHNMRQPPGQRPA